MARTRSLGEYEGLPVRKLGIEVRNTAGGLQKAMKVEAAAIKPGETRYVVYEVMFDAFRHDPMDEGDAWTLVAIGHAASAAFLDKDLVKDAIEETNRRIIEFEDEEKGREQITPELARATQLANDHAAGKHKRRRKECGECYPDGADDGATGATGATPIGSARSKRASETS